MAKIKVIHNVEYWLPQTMTWLYGQVSNLPTGEIENIIVCEKTQNLDQFPIPNIYSLNSEPGINGFIRKALRRLGIKVELNLLTQIIEKEKPQILHSHFGHFGWFNHKLAKRFKLKHVVTFYGVDVNMLPQNPKWKSRYKEMFSNIDLCLCEGPYMAECIIKLGCTAEKVKVQRLGIDVEKIKFLPRNFSLKEPLKFLIAGTFREKKGIPYALEALGLYQQHNNNFTITLIGDAGKKKLDFFNTSQIEKNKILEIISKYNLHDKIKMTGFIRHEEMIKEAYQSHIFLSPSIVAADGDTEGGAPVGIIEMAASGMPVLSTTHCDIPFVMSKENAELLVNEQDSKQLLNSLLKFLAFSEDEKLKLVQANRTFIEKNLDVKNCAKQLAQHYQSLLK